MTPVTRGRNDLWGGLLRAVGVVLGLGAFAGVSLFRVALVGFFVWLAVARGQRWAWIPAAIFGMKIVSSILESLGGSLLLPLLVIAGGVLLLARDRLSPRATTWILIGLVIAGVNAANRDSDDEPPVLEPPAAAPSTEPSAPEAPEPALLPDLDGRELEIRAGVADLEIGPASAARGSVDSESDFQVIEEGDLVILALGAGDYAIEIPAEADVLVITEGDVIAETGGYDLEIDSNSGDIDIRLGGPVQLIAESRRGSITAAEGLEDRDPSDELFLYGDSGPRISVESRRGDISISTAA